MNVKELYIKFSQDQVQFSTKDNLSADPFEERQPRKNDASLEIRMVRTFHKVLNIPQVCKELDGDNFQTLGEILMKVLSDIWAELPYFLKSILKDPSTRCRVYLDFDKQSGGFAELPWEYLFQDGEFLGAHRKKSFDLIRKIPRATAFTPGIKTAAALNIIYLACDPGVGRYEKIMPNKLDEAIFQPLQDLYGATKIRTFAMDPATTAGTFKKNFAIALAKLREETKDEPYVFHFLGHALVKDGKNGCLVFPPINSANPDPDEVNESRFENFFADTNDGPQLAVLQACSSGRIVDYDENTGIALRLASRRNVPAVVAMQNDVTIESSLQFIRHFYDRILSGDDVAEAMTSARKYIGDDYLGELGKSAFSQNLFGSPVLLLTTVQPFVLIPKQQLNPATDNPPPILVKECIQKLHQPRCNQTFSMEMLQCPYCNSPLAVRAYSQPSSTAVADGTATSSVALDRQNTGVSG